MTKYKPKKNNRFLIKGITYDLSDCTLDNNEFYFEISSKIPENLLDQRTKKVKFFKDVVKLVNKSDKRPSSATMENIVKSSAEAELKERDYICLTYRYNEKELYTAEEIENLFKSYQKKRTPLPVMPGVNTPHGKMVVLLVKESIAKGARSSILALMNANEGMKAAFQSEPAKK